MFKSNCTKCKECGVNLKERFYYTDSGQENLTHIVTTELIKDISICKNKCKKCGNKDYMEDFDLDERGLLYGNTFSNRMEESVENKEEFINDEILELKVLDDLLEEVITLKQLKNSSVYSEKQKTNIITSFNNLKKAESR
jgi:hypothetical protein